MTGEDKKKLDFIFGINKILTARANALRPENVNYIKIILGRHTEGMNDFTEATFDDPETVNILIDVIKTLQEKDNDSLEKAKAKIKHIKIKF